MLENDAWCSQSEAARRLTLAGDDVSQQQLSRYLDTWPEIPRKGGENGQAMLVDFTALAEHRRQNIRVQEAKEKPEADDAAGAELRLRERRANAELREFELAKARGEVIARATVQRGVQAAAVALEQTMRATRHARAERLEAATDTRAKVIALEEQDRALQQAFAEALSRLAAQESGDDNDDFDPEAEEQAPATPPS